MLRPFHLAIPVNDLDKARSFYGELLGFDQGRSDSRWIDWNCYGHQLVTHLHEEWNPVEPENPVDGHGIPVPHFGVVLEKKDWENLAARLTDQVEFIIQPYTRFKGELGEQSTMFFRDPSGNALEFKAFNDLSMLFAT